MARARCSSVTVSSLGFSATSSCTPTTSYCRSSGGSNVCAFASVSLSHAGWSVRSLSLLVLMNAARSATDSKAYKSSSLPRNASHSSPSSRQRGAHNVYRSPLVSPSRIGTISAAMRHSLTTQFESQVVEHASGAALVGGPIDGRHPRAGPAHGLVEAPRRRLDPARRWLFGSAAVGRDLPPQPGIQSGAVRKRS